MFKEVELLAAIDELQEGKHTISNVAKLAAIYTVLDHITSIDRGYSADNAPITQQRSTDMDNYIEHYGDSEFLQAIEGKKPKDIWLLMDELMATLSLVNSALYHSVMSRIDN